LEADVQCRSDDKVKVESCRRKALDLMHERHSYRIYQHSYLGYGLIEARNKIISAQLSPDANGEHPCLPRHFQMMKAAVKGYQDANFVAAPQKCHAIVSQIFQKDQCPYEGGQCSFNGVFQPDLHRHYVANDQHEFHIFSYFYDRTRLLLDMQHEDEDLAFDQWTVADLKLLSHITCSLHHPDKMLVMSDTDLNDNTDVETVEQTTIFKRRFKSTQQLIRFLHQKIHGDAASGDNQFLCLDFTFMYQLLARGYSLKDSQPVKIRKKIGDFEMGWCLGSALEMLDSPSASSSSNL
jgi:guanosine-diphosphatase